MPTIRTDFTVEEATFSNHSEPTAANGASAYVDLLPDAVPSFSTTQGSQVSPNGK